MDKLQAQELTVKAIIENNIELKVVMLLIEEAAKGGLFECSTPVLNKYRDVEAALEHFGYKTTGSTDNRLYISWYV